MFYIIYKITNRVNGKFYIGTHKTVDPNDNYMGSGALLKRAIKKYGLDNFVKEVLHTYDNPKDMYAKEAEIVNLDFLAEENTYNLKVGGFGGWDYINENSLNGFSDRATAQLGRKKANESLEEKYGPDWRKLFMTDEQRSLSARKSAETKKLRGYKSSTAHMNTPDMIAKKMLKYKSTGHQKGKRNSNYGKIWITDGKESRSIHKNDVIPEGWHKGRVIKKS